MTTKLRGKIIPKDYKLILFRKMKNIKKNSMEYTEEFYKVNIRSRHVEGTPKRVASSVNGLRFDIHDGLSLWSLRSVVRFL